MKKSFHPAGLEILLLKDAIFKGDYRCRLRYFLRCIKMKKLLLSFMIVGGLIFSISGHAEDNARQTSLKKYYSEVNGTLSTCASQFKLAALMGEITNSPVDVKNSYKCISDSKIEIKKAYEAVTDTIVKSAAKTALKEHYIGAVSALQGIQIQDDERKINYDKRQGENKAKVAELWLRFETEN